jgi:hypothetical protein
MKIKVTNLNEPKEVNGEITFETNEIVFENPVKAIESQYGDIVTDTILKDVTATAISHVAGKVTREGKVPVELQKGVYYADLDKGDNLIVSVTYSATTDEGEEVYEVDYETSFSY